TTGHRRDPGRNRAGREVTLMQDPVEINGLPLPAVVIAGFASGTWRAPRDPELWYKQFPSSEVVRPLLYDLGLMRDVNAHWWNESRPVYLGQSDGKSQPGDLEPHRSLLIGELQPDALIALDYRSSMESPSVVYLMPYDDGGRWMLVAPT